MKLHRGTLTSNGEPATPDRHTWRADDERVRAAIDAAVADIRARHYAVSVTPDEPDSPINWCHHCRDLFPCPDFLAVERLEEASGG